MMFEGDMVDYMVATDPKVWTLRSRGKKWEENIIRPIIEGALWMHSECHVDIPMLFSTLPLLGQERVE